MMSAVVKVFGLGAMFDLSPQKRCKADVDQATFTNPDFGPTP